MDFKNINLFQAMKHQMSWLNQRQKVLSANIANADTPKYRPSDVKPLDFKQILRNKVTKLEASTTSANHLIGRPDKRGPYKAREERKPYETAIAGNAVVIEEQVMKMNENAINHKLTNELYKKQLRMFKVALGKG